jgi:hypothetical protein
MDDLLPEAADERLPCPPGFAGSAVRHREPGDLVALRVEAAAMTGVALAGVGWIPGGATTRTRPGRAHRSWSDRMDCLREKEC